jgi:hypothetical protein
MRLFLQDTLRAYNSLGVVGFDRTRVADLAKKLLCALGVMAISLSMVVIFHFVTLNKQVLLEEKTATCLENSEGCTSRVDSVVNRFGFSPPSASGTQGNQEPLLVADNYIISWVKDHEWANGIDQEKALKQDFTYASTNNRLPMLTLEPWPSKGSSSRTLLQDIAQGKYEREIAWVCRAVRDYAKPVLIRWGHEMENITGRYPWATRDGEAYKSAYKHFVTKCRTIAANGWYMWSPAGNKNLNEYWPGSEYVDYVGITVYDYEAWELRYYGYNRSFKENFEERYVRVKDYGLPIVIAEFGATGEGRSEWISSALQEVQNYPRVKGILFFSALDPVSWGPMPAPDWRIPAACCSTQ